MPPYGRWGGWCISARPSQLAYHIPGDKVRGPGHADTWPNPGTVQRHASLWSRGGAQTTLLRWGTLHFARKWGTLDLCVITRLIKLKRKTVPESPCATGESVAVLISSVAPDSRDLCGFYGLCRVCPAALLVKRRHTGIVTEATWQSTHLQGQQTVYGTEYEWQQNCAAAIKRQ